MLDVHLNDQILFIEVSQGLNRDKIELLTYKIDEVLQLYGMTRPRVLVMLTDISIGDDTTNLQRLFEQILKGTASPMKRVMTLTASTEVRSFLTDHDKLGGIAVTDNIGDAMDKLLGVKIDTFVEEGKDLMQQDILSAKQTEPEQVQLKFSSDAGQKAGQPAGDAPVPGQSQATPTLNLPQGIAAAVVRTFVTNVFAKSGWTVHAYENGKQFLENVKQDDPVLVFLDLQMPVMNGFQVLQYMRDHSLDIPVIILSALTQKETIVKAQGYGVNSYLIKLVNPDQVRKKSIEALSATL